MKNNLFATAALCGLACFAGCKNDKGGEEGGSGAAGVVDSAPAFTLSWSEYPSWSVFGVAEANGLIDKEEGAHEEADPTEDRQRRGGLSRAHRHEAPEGHLGHHARLVVAHGERDVARDPGRRAGGG